MFSWMRDPIAEFFHGRRNSRTRTNRSTSQSEDNSETVDPLNSDEPKFYVKIIGLDGSVYPIAANSSFTVKNLKSAVIKNIYNNDSLKFFSDFRLVDVSKIKLLADDETLQKAEINDSTELLLVDYEKFSLNEINTETFQEGPTKEDIYRATVHLPIRNLSTSEQPKKSLTFQEELRQILITLVRTSAKILMFSQEAPKLYISLKQRLRRRYEPINDNNAIKDLTEAGFPKKKVIKALQINNLNASRALEYLIDYGEYMDEEDWEPAKVNTDFSLEMPKSSSADEMEEPNLILIVEQLLESFRQFRRLEISYKWKKAQEQFTSSSNEEQKNLPDLDQGLDINGPEYEAIMSDSYIRIGLNKPKVLLALLSILEDPSSIRAYDTDPEITSVLAHIFSSLQ